MGSYLGCQLLQSMGLPASFALEVVKEVVKSLIIIFFCYWLLWFSCIEKLGCLWATCCCCYGNLALGFLGVMSVLQGLRGFAAAQAANALRAMFPDLASLFLYQSVFNVVQGIIYVGNGVAVILVAVSPKEQRKNDLQKTLLLDA